MRTKFLAAIAALGMTAGVLATLSSQATASTTVPSCDTANMSTASGQCLDYTSTSSFKVTDTSASAATSKGKIALTSMGRMSVRAQRRTTCKWVNGGYNALNDDANNVHWVKWPYKTKICRSKSSPTGWVKVNSKDHTGWPKNCKNFFMTHKPRKVLRISQVEYVKSFSHWKFSGKVTAKASATGDASAKAWCTTTGASATGSGSGHATSSATSSASFTVSGKSRVKAAIKGAEAKLKQTLTLKVANAVKSSATATAVGRASAKARCASTTPSSPPSSPPPTIVSMTTINDVDMGGTSPNFCATADLPGSDAGTLSFTAKYGSFTTSTFSVSGMEQECTTYVAPNDPTSPSGLTESVTVTVRDTTTGLSASKSETFPVNPPAVHP